MRLLCIGDRRSRYRNALTCARLDKADNEFTKSVEKHPTIPCPAYQDPRNQNPRSKSTAPMAPMGFCSHREPETLPRALKQTGSFVLQELFDNTTRIDLARIINPSSLD